MSRNYKFRNPDAMYFVTFSVVYWIDLFIRAKYKEILLESWEYCQKHKSLRIHAWCIMTSHVHLIISSEANKLSDIMRDMKRHTSTKLKLAIEKNPKESRKRWMLAMMRKAGKENGNNKGFQLWQQHNHPIELFNHNIFLQKLNYIHKNPVVTGFVLLPEHYPFSSARDYHGDQGYLTIEKVT